MEMKGKMELFATRKRYQGTWRPRDGGRSGAHGSGRHHSVNDMIRYRTIVGKEARPFTEHVSGSGSGPRILRDLRHRSEEIGIPYC